MGTEYTSPTDWKRLLLGDAPVIFLVEVLIRATLVYGLLLVVVRLLGKRMSGQMTNLEMGVMIALGAIVSVPMQIPERGLLPGAALLLALLAVQRGLSALSVRSDAVERATSGSARVLVRDGLILPDELRKSRISHEQMFSALRGRGLRHLGQARRVYFEATGTFAVIPNPRSKPGLWVLPRLDHALEHGRSRAEGHEACGYCGLVVETSENGRGASRRDEPCTRCGRTEWTAAAVDAPASERSSEEDD